MLQCKVALLTLLYTYYTKVSIVPNGSGYDRVAPLHLYGLIEGKT